MFLVRSNSDICSLSFLSDLCHFDYYVQAGFVDRHFDQDLNFLATEEDPVTKKVSFENWIFFTLYSFLVITIMFGFLFYRW